VPDEDPDPDPAQAAVTAINLSITYDASLGDDAPARLRRADGLAVPHRGC
jgi:hypothetical protein